mmetsp:Transcript_7535/g.6283  ORF Transcript_7535/g.6283 Transcript_7535/m.6283 type:complete len:89 (-) Transcript_7535:2-268(-)
MELMIETAALYHMCNNHTKYYQVADAAARVTAILSHQHQMSDIRKRRRIEILRGLIEHKKMAAAIHLNTIYLRGLMANAMMMMMKLYD